MLGAALGNAVGEKFRQPKTGYGDIPPEIAARLNTVKATKDAYAKWEATNANAPYEQRAEKYQELLAESAFKSGAEDIGINVLRELQDRRISTAQKQAELEKLGYENKYDKQTLEARIAKALYESNKEGVVQFYLRGSQNPDSGRTGRLDANGNIASVDDEGKPVTHSSGMYTFDRPQWHPAMYGNGGGGGGQELSKAEEYAARRAVVNTMALTGQYADVLDLVNEAGTAGAGNVTGQYGKLVSLANRWSGFAEQIATLGSPDGRIPTFTYVGGKKDYDINSSSGRAAWAKDNADWVRKHVPNLASKGKFADQYIAQITELAYAKAMAMEGGSSRSLSDNDFKNSFISIGGAINDPRALAEVLLRDADRRFRTMEDTLSVYSPATVERIVAERGFERLGTSRKRLEDYRNGNKWGSTEQATAPKQSSRPPRKGWSQAELDALTDEEYASLK
jgi:hypothetical protein